MSNGIHIYFTKALQKQHSTPPVNNYGVYQKGNRVLYDVGGY